MVGENFFYVCDPDLFKEIRRNEGKYPEAFKLATHELCQDLYKDETQRGILLS